jgi:alkylhydroperoxidase family enzyme
MTSPTSSAATPRITPWTPELKPQPTELVQTIMARRQGRLLNLDHVLLWSEPVARGWNTFMGNVRTALSVERKWLELGICTVALLTGAHYEYHHHRPDFLAAGGKPEELEALERALAADPCQSVNEPELGAVERLIVQYAAQITRQIQVDDAVFTALRQHLDTTGLVELTMSISAYNMVARVLIATGIQPED